MILILFDGSPDARAAVEHAGELLAGHSATVLSLWEPVLAEIARRSFGRGVPGPLDVQEVDHDDERRAEQLAEEGAELARSKGLDARAQTQEQRGTFAFTVLSEADRLEASAIVMGSRGLGPVGSVLMGSASHAVLQHADRPVLVVPSPSVAEARAGARAAHRREPELA